MSDELNKTKEAGPKIEETYKIDKRRMVNIFKTKLKNKLKKSFEMNRFETY
jgi:hypothetical protein